MPARPRIICALWNGTPARIPSDCLRAFTGIRNNDRAAILAAIEEANIAIFVDTDDDGLPDVYEDRNANGVRDPDETDPWVADTDGDGVSDGLEVNFGYDPLDPENTPQVPAATPRTVMGLIMVMLVLAYVVIRPARRN